jgi:hypothetical protein
MPLLPERCADSHLDCISCARYVLDPSALFGDSIGQRQDGDPFDRVPPEFPSTLPAHCSHTGKRTNRETRVDTVRAG